MELYRLWLALEWDRTPEVQQMKRGRPYVGGSALTHGAIPPMHHCF
jgi:hypothetical protein